MLGTLDLAVSLVCFPGSSSLHSEDCVCSLRRLHFLPWPMARTSLPGSQKLVPYLPHAILGFRRYGTRESASPLLTDRQVMATPWAK